MSMAKRSVAAALPQHGYHGQQYQSPQLPVVIADNARCSGCGICQELCLAGAIDINDVAVVDPGRCVLCGVCIESCPEEALRWSSSGDER